MFIRERRGDVKIFVLFVGKLGVLFVRSDEGRLRHAVLGALSVVRSFLPSIHSFFGDARIGHQA